MFLRLTYQECKKGIIMTFTKNILSAVGASFMCGAIALTANAKTESQDDYLIQLINDCEVVSEYSMNAEQIEAYKNLQAAEIKMEQLEQPIDNIEDQIDDLSDKVEEFYQLAFQEDDQGMFINKAYLAKQNQAAAKLQSFMAEHSGSFKALEAQGRVIGKLAKTFTMAIKTNMPDVEHHQIHIKSPENPDSNYYCNNYITGI